MREFVPGDCFGEMALMDLFPRSASIRALADCTAIELTPDDLMRLYEHDLEQFTLVQMNIGREVCRRLRATDELLFRARMGDTSVGDTRRFPRTERRHAGSATELVAEFPRALLRGDGSPRRTPPSRRWLQRRQRRVGGAALGGDALAQHARADRRAPAPARSRRRRWRARAGLPCSGGRPISRAACDHRLDEIEDIGRAGPGQRGDGVEVLFARRPTACGRSARAPPRRAALSRRWSPRRARTGPAMPWPISAGVFGMARTTRWVPAARAMASLRMPAITLRCSAPPTNGAHGAAARLEQLRLDRPHHDAPPAPSVRIGRCQRAHAEVAAAAARAARRRGRRRCDAASGPPTARRWRWPCCRRR